VVAKYWLSVNHKPTVQDDSFGFWRRMRLIPFTHQFPLNQNFGARLGAEAAGILAWAVRGCLLWWAEGLSPPAAVLDATAEYQRESDDLGEFLFECCRVDDPKAEARASALFTSYKA
jgi:putative DNA primase/helicase